MMIFLIGFDLFIFICLLCYGKLKKIILQNFCHFSLEFLKFLRLCLTLTEQEGKKEGERGGDFEEGSWGDKGSDREVGIDE